MMRTPAIRRTNCQREPLGIQSERRRNPKYTKVLADTDGNHPSRLRQTQPKIGRFCMCLWSWLKVGIASRVVAVCLHGLVATTGIASGVNGKHHNQDSDAVYPGVVDHS
jgi:hypothetical protein